MTPDVLKQLEEFCEFPKTFYVLVSRAVDSDVIEIRIREPGPEGRYFLLTMPFQEAK